MTTDRTEQDPLGVWPDAAPPRAGQTPLAPPLMASAPPVRVAEPMVVLWQGVEYPVQDWDLHGLSLRAPIPGAMAPGQGRVVDFLLLIGQGDTRLSMLVQARLQPGDESGCAYQFLHLGRAQSELLHRIVTAAVSRQELSLTQLLNDTHEVKAARKATVAQVQSTRSWFQMGLAGLVIAAAGGALWNNLTTVKARYAAVTAVAAQVSVPASGMVTQLAVRPGMPVTEGQVLAHIRPADFDQRREDAATRLRALEAEQADLRQRQRAVQAMGLHDVELRASERAMRERALTLAETRLSVERAQLATLMGSGLPTPERQAARARQQALALAAEQELLAARTALAVFEAEEATGLGSSARASLSLAGMTPEALELRLGHLSQEIALAYAREDSLTEGIPVLSPCDCAVVQVNRGVGEWADPAKPVFVLAQGAATSIHALVLAEEARGLSEGSRARIRLANGTQVTGQVQRVGYGAEWNGFAGLSQTIFAPERYARVEIAPEGHLSAPVGMTAQVSLRKTDMIGNILTFFGFQTGQTGEMWQ